MSIHVDTASSTMAELATCQNLSSSMFIYLFIFKSSEIYTSRDNTKATKPGQYSKNELYPKLN